MSCVRLDMDPVCEDSFFWPKLTCCERDHPQPGKRHQGVVEPVADRSANTGQEPRTDVLDRQAWGHIWGIDYREGRETEQERGREARKRETCWHWNTLDIPTKCPKQSPRQWSMMGVLGVRESIQGAKSSKPRWLTWCESKSVLA